MAAYFYARVSTATQNADRQVDEAKRQGFFDRDIFIDYESGKDFNRTEWRKLLRKLRKGDEVWIKSLDRLGRNYREVLDVWNELTKKKSVDVVVLDMELLDTRRQKNLLGTFIADLVLQILAFVAENERANIRARQREGIDAAKARGVRFGRPNITPPPAFFVESLLVMTGKKTQTAAADSLGVPLSTFRGWLGLKSKKKKKNGAGNTFKSSGNNNAKEENKQE